MSVATGGTGHDRADDHDHDHDHHDHDDAVAATVAGDVVTVAAVRAKEAAVRSGPFAARLPVERTPQGRNVRRWVVQLLVTERIVEREAAARGLSPSTSPVALDVHRAVALGGVVATVLATCPVAPAVRDAVTSDVDVTPEQVRDHHARNLDRYTEPGTLDLDRVVDGRCRPWPSVRLGELPARWEQLLLAAPPGDPVMVAPGRTFVLRHRRAARVAPIARVAPALAATLREDARDARFGEWIGARIAADVRLDDRFAHPGDPAHPDATHRH